MKNENDPCGQARPYRLINHVQNYPWGGRGDRAYIAHLLGIIPEDDQAFAELWMGTHPKAPSRVIDPDGEITDLQTWIDKDPSSRLGQAAADRHAGKLPFLLKVLSAEQALSIQAHPSKTQAVALHGKDPEHYPDDNHKPEIAIALDHLDALAGFIPLDHFSSLLETVPELAGLFQDIPISQNLKPAVKHLLELTHKDPEAISNCIQKLVRRFSQHDTPSETEKLFLALHEQWGDNDPGLLFLFLLNHVHLGPGEALYLASGVPHAYLRGNIIECMANSDNVVRLGLTKKYCDISALEQILEYGAHPALNVVSSNDGFLTDYQTDAEEFFVRSLVLLDGESKAFSYREALSMFILIEGEIALKWGDSNSQCSCRFRRGDVFITPANLASFTIHCKSPCKLFVVDIPS